MSARSGAQKKKLKSRANVPLLLTAFLLAIVAFVIRIYAFSTPVFGDEAVYSILGERAIQGGRPYIDFYEMKPPLMFYAYGLGSAIFGWSVMGLRIYGFCVVLVNCGLIYLIARKFTNGTLALLVSAFGLYAMNNIFIFGTETASEHFVMTFVLSGYYFLIHRFSKRKSLNILIAGFLIAGAAMVKQTAAIFGLGAIAYMVIQSYSKIDLYEKKVLGKNILVLAVGAFAMLLLNVLPVLIAGSMSEAKYWLIDYPAGYANLIDWNEGLQNLREFGVRVLTYQPFTSLLLLISLLSLFLNFRVKYFSFIIILLTCSLINIIPGYRFYGQYWLPIMLLLPLCLIALNDTINRVRFNTKHLILPLLVILSVSGDVYLKNDLYFEKQYVKNSHIVYGGNMTAEITQMLAELEKTISPQQTFGVLGIEAYAYLKMDRFPKQNNIYPILISRDNEQNKIYQEETLNEIRKADYDYLFYSVRSRSWRSSATFNDYLYLQLFNYVRSNYEPIYIFNIDENKYYIPDNGDVFDWSKKNQYFTLRKKRTQ